MRLLFVTVAAVLAARPAAATDYTWTNAAGGNWATAGNWTPAGGVPSTAADNATLGALANSYAVSLNANETVSNLTVNSANATLTQIGGTLTVGVALVVTSGTYTLSGGTLALNGTMTTGAGGSVNWAGATLAGSGSLNGTLAVTGGGYVSGISLQNKSIINWQSGAIYNATVSAVLTNAAAGVIAFQYDGTAFANYGGGNGTLGNQGTLRKTGGFATSTDVNWAVTLSNGGTLDGQVGTLRLNNGGLLGNGTTTVSGAGAVQLSGGTFTVSNGTTFTAGSSGGATLQWAGATLGGGGNLAGTLAVTDGGYVSGSALQNVGTISWQSGAIYNATVSAVLTNAAAGVIAFQYDGTAFANYGGGNGTLGNQGTLRKTGGTASNTNVGWSVINSGTILNNVAGTLNLTGGVTNTGTLNMVNGSTIGGAITSNTNGLLQGPAGGGTGTYSGSLTFNSGSTFAAGGVGGSGTLLVGGSLTMAGGATFHVDLNGIATGTGYDRVRLTSNGTGTSTTLGGATLAGATGAGFNPSGSDLLFVLVNDNNNPVSGTFAGLPQGATGTLGGWNFKISYTGNYTGDTGPNSISGGNDVVLYQFAAAVPEPASVLGVGAAALGIAAGWRKRQRARTYARIAT